MQALYRLNAVLALILMLTPSSALQRQRCRGQEGFFRASGNRLSALKTAVNDGNCTVVENNLIIWDITATADDFSFLASITEIKGFLYIDGVTATHLPLTNLRVVRGRDTRLIQPRETKSGDFSVALIDLLHLEEWPFPNLEEVTEGSVLLLNVPKLAYNNTIDWEDIQNRRVGDVVSYHVGTGRNGNDSCDIACQGLCWTSTKCQTRSLKICDVLCPHRCLGDGPFDCCNSECTGSCRAVEDETTCSACRTFENGGVCEDRCPLLTVYDRNIGRFILNPNGRYIYEDQCLSSCPFGFFSVGQKCVHRCPDGQEPNKGVCVDCKGVCPKVCDAPGDGVIDSSNVANYTNCTRIAGFIRLDSTLSGSSQTGLSLVTQDDLEAFREVRSISGNLQVFGIHSGIKSLKFFRNLEKIEGQTTYDDSREYALYVYLNNGLVDLGFPSLHTVTGGSIFIFDQKKLCVPTSPDGLLVSKVILRTVDSPTVFLNPSNPCDESMCHSQCNRTIGCWSPADDSTCLACISFDYEGRCVSNCTASTTGTNLIYHNDTSQKCLPCHPECAAGCDGPDQNECDACRNVRDGDFCYIVCPPQKYRDNSSVCQDCNDACKVGGECTGPGAHKGPGGCDDCDLFFVDPTETKVFHCVNITKGCPESYYGDKVTDRNHTFFGLLICRPCHPSCSICHDAGRECQFCSPGFVQNDGVCNEECPETKYAATDRTCQNCPINCGQSGCSLDQASGQPKCKPCQGLLEEKNEIDHCVVACSDAKPYSYEETRRCYAECPRDTYNRTQDRVCLSCNDQCQRPDDNEKWMCSDGTSREGSCLLGCKNVEQKKICVSQCNEEYVEVRFYVIGDEEVKVEDPTTQTPGEEAGGENEVIGKEKEMKVYPIKRRCKDRQAEETDKGAGTAEGNENLVPVIVGGTIGVIVVIAVIGVALTFGHRWYKERILVYTEEEMGARNNPMYGGGGEMGMLDMKSGPAAVAPTDARLILVPESALETEEILGTGAFGTVYKGNWLPEGETEKLPVAIKVLNEGTGKAASKELLQEAVVMASMDHLHLVRLLCVCMASRVMLVTQLMPLGSLLTYLRKRKRTLTGEALMVFSQQIAKGMVYLEEKRLVHRDLAARNVLVQTPKMVKISDFGLSKMLDVGEGHFQSVGEKMPIKWLSPESLRELKFTHKSDVWAFGVTVWEVMTFGNQPFKGTKGSDMYKLLMTGERLPHPKICTHEVYALMLQCWMIEPENRPTFRSLARQLTVMCKNTSKFVRTEADEVMAEGNAKMRTGTYETAVLMSGEWSDADDDGYDNAAGPTFNPYENPRDCIPEAAYSNTVQLDMIDEEGDEDGVQYDNTVMPQSGNVFGENNGYENPHRKSTHPLISSSSNSPENPYDNPLGEESEAGVTDTAYDNIEAPQKDDEVHYDNPLEPTATDKNHSLDTHKKDGLYEDPDVLDGGDDDMMDSDTGYQDPLTVGVDK